ncbi:MAG: 16S rRNA (adenine(1518)-N(6)/adenine(1519)-N(6))-dimethyltransferase RsmA [Bacillota bacterium]
MKDKIATPKITKKILKKYDINLKKKLGQNLLIDQNILDKIIEAADLSAKDTVVEIGSGIGSLTEKILDTVNRGKVIGIEKDERFIKILKDLFSKYNNLLLINKDVRDIDWSDFFKTKNINFDRVKVMGNLPYYISTPVIMNLLETNFIFSSLTFMIQKEVARRMTASPGTKDYGLLSVAVQFYSKPEIFHEVPPTVFLPQPEVYSSIITLEPFKEIPYEAENQDYFFKVVKAIFQLRRKNIKNSIVKGSILSIKKEIVKKALQKCGISPKIRGENLSIEEMVSLSNILYNMKKERSD